MLLLIKGSAQNAPARPHSPLTRRRRSGTFWDHPRHPDNRRDRSDVEQHGKAVPPALRRIDQGEQKTGSAGAVVGPVLGIGQSHWRGCVPLPVIGRNPQSAPLAVPHPWSNGTHRAGTGSAWPHERRSATTPGDLAWPDGRERLIPCGIITNLAITCTAC